MIDNREYGVKPSQLWKVRYQVHSHHLEGFRMGVSCDRLKWGFSMSGAWFVLLTGSASLYITFGEIFHVLPLISLSEEVYSVCNAWVSGKGMVVVSLQHSTSFL